MVSKNIKVPKIMHFIWLGKTKKKFLDNVNLWAKVNQDYQVYYWYDNNIKKYKTDNNIKCKEKLYLQKYRYFHQNYHKVENNGKKKLKWSNKADNIKIMNLSEKLDFNLKIKNCLIFETYFRNNFASLSDIYRLCILYQYGGVYIDVDTLPQKNHHNLKKILLNENTWNNFIRYNLKKRKLFLTKNNFFKKNKNIKYHKITDLENIFLSLHELEVIENYFKISAFNFKGTKVYFSNVIITHQKSLLIKKCLNQLIINYSEIIKLFINKKQKELYPYLFDEYNQGKETLLISGPLLLNSCLIKELKENINHIDNIDNYLFQYFTYHNFDMFSKESLDSYWIKK